LTRRNKLLLLILGMVSVVATNHLIKLNY